MEGVKPHNPTAAVDESMVLVQQAQGSGFPTIPSSLDVGVVSHVDVTERQQQAQVEKTTMPICGSDVGGVIQKGEMVPFIPGDPQIFFICSWRW